MGLLLQHCTTTNYIRKVDNNHIEKYNFWSPRREFLNKILFESTTPLGRGSDIVLFILIVSSVVAVMLESIDQIRSENLYLLITLEWIFTVIFTIEYILRLYCSHDHARYARSFFGVVDLLAVIPTYLSLLLPGAQALIVIRILRYFGYFVCSNSSNIVGLERIFCTCFKKVGNEYGSSFLRFLFWLQLLDQ